ncbi:MAG: hypothetical protein HY960_06525 [Ignavibacteriae bacterium]|nr:hypothetical protein [Ignavibacteriota bacterium]
MIPYIAAAHSFEQHDKKQLHDKVYEEVKKSVPSHVYTELTQGDYRQTMLNDVEAFYQQLPFYKPKLLYVWLIHALTQLGFNSITAMSILSVTTSFIASLMILLFLLHETSGIYPYVFSVLIINISGLLDVARLFTPDALSACISLLAIFLLLKKKNIWVVIVLAVASIWVRVDNLLFFLLIFTYLHFFSFKDYRIATIIYFVSIALCATSYIIINYGITNYGWSTLIYHITVNKIITPENFQSPLSFLDYIVILIKRWLIQFVTNPLLSFFLVTGFSTGYLFRLINRDSKIFIYGHITIIMALSIVIHFVLFPDLLNRYFVTQYGLGAIAFSITLYHFIQSRQTHLFEQETPIS